MESFADRRGSFIERPSYGRIDSEAPAPALRTSQGQHVIEQEPAECLGIGFRFHRGSLCGQGLVPFLVGHALGGAARTMPTLVPTMPAIKASNTRLVARTTGLLRRRNFFRR